MTSSPPDRGNHPRRKVGSSSNMLSTDFGRKAAATFPPNIQQKLADKYKQEQVEPLPSNEEMAAIQDQISKRKESRQ